MNKEEEFQLHDGENTIGRSSSNDICVLDKKSSRAHCKLILKDDTMTLVDLGSTNGVRVNGNQVNYEEQVFPTDHIQIGQTVFIVSEQNEKKTQRELSETEKIRKQKKYNNLLQKTAFQMTQTSNMKKVKAKLNENDTGFIAYFKKQNHEEE